MHGRYIDESAAGVDDGRFSPWISPEEKETCIFLVRILRLFFVRIDIVKDLLSRLCLIF